MPLITSSKTKPAYDVIIVGSGAAGGQSAYVLALSGAKVLMLEAGRNYDPITETPMLNPHSQAPLRAVGTPDKPFGFYDATVNGGWRVPNEPYLVRRSRRGPGWYEATDDDLSTTDQNFMWWRPRMLGGRTNHWGRIALRMGPYDFKPRARDGLGIDWPFRYEELAPYYDKVESLIGVFGSNEGLENTPNSPDGVLLPPPKPRAYELLIKKACAGLKIPVIPSHLAILTRTLDAKKVSSFLHPYDPKVAGTSADAMRNRLACIWATPCGRGCAIKANYQSTTVHLPPALASGNLDIVTDAMVREVTLGPDGKADGVLYIDKKSRKEMRAKARVVVLAASGCESARILLNSKNNKFPNGLANSSGKVGRYLMDTVGSDLSGQIPALENCPAYNEDGVSGMHMYTPWWLYQEQLAKRIDFPRGYQIEIGGGREMPGMETFAGLEAFTGGTYGKKLKEDARRYYGSFVGFAGRGEMIPNEDSYCEVDPDRKDAWGIPVLRFHFKWSAHEEKQAAHMQKTFAEIIEAMGGKVLGKPQLDGKKAIAPGGSIIHEVGTTCMGSDPKKSVLNQYCQAWDVKNLFVTDGGPFVSNADKNPTLTIMANAWRACDYLVDAMKKGEI
ncbi:MAG TPA: GMC family oxidoreductase [Patescibacteria group bacterium]|nr:GMC family oxidoreductase [Patescibacteria group bacterium]